MSATPWMQVGGISELEYLLANRPLKDVCRYAAAQIEVETMRDASEVDKSSPEAPTSRPNMPVAEEADDDLG